MGIADSIRNIRAISEIGVRAYDALTQSGLWPRSRRSTGPLGAVALVGLGAAVGAGLALALAPSAGSELRSSLGERLRVLSKNWLGDLGLEPSAASVDVQGEGGERAEAKEVDLKEGDRSSKNGAGPRRKHTSHSTSNAS